MLSTFLLTALLTLGPATPAAHAEPLTGSTLFVPSYTQLPFGPKPTLLDVAANLVVRNLSTDTPITLTSVDYLGARGEMLEHLLPIARTLAPLASTQFYIHEKDVRGGPNTGFLVRWKASRPVDEPLTEVVVIGVVSGQGLSVTSRGIRLAEPRPQNGPK